MRQAWARRDQGRLEQRKRDQGHVSAGEQPEQGSYAGREEKL